MSSGADSAPFYIFLRICPRDPVLRVTVAQFPLSRVRTAEQIKRMLTAEPIRTVVRICTCRANPTHWFRLDRYSSSSMIAHFSSFIIHDE